MIDLPEKIVIAVDGPSSSGKSTFAKAIAKELGYIYIDSGAMYRACTLFCLQNNLIRGGELDVPEMLGLLHRIQIAFRPDPVTGVQSLYLNGVNVEKEIRGIEVSGHVSMVSKISEVRGKMVALQRELGKNKGIVMDGRDIGSVVFPGAEIKIFLVADQESRVRRRYLEMMGKGDNTGFEEVLDNIVSRDRIDSTREISPLTRAADAILLDNSRMSIDEELDWFRNLIKARFR